MIFVFIYLCLGLVVFLGQRRLLYFPLRTPIAVQRQMAMAEGFQEWLNAQGEVIGWKQTSASHLPRSRLLIVHGNAGNAINRLDYARGLQDLGPWDVYILEYPGYGARSGKPSQRSFFKAADEAIGLLKPDGPVYIMGESIGTGVAAYLAGTRSEVVRGLLLIAPYNRLVPVAQAHMRIFPAWLFLLDRFPSEDYLESYHGPVAMLFAGNDRIVPNRFGHRLYDGYRGPKKFWEIPGAGHNDLLQQPADWWRGLVDFWNTHQAEFSRTNA
jgi:hypothetical protein